jgi:hypothetical protein
METRWDTAASSSVASVQGRAGTSSSGSSVSAAIVMTACLSRVLDLPRISLLFRMSCACLMSSATGLLARVRSRSSRSDVSSDDLIELKRVSNASARAVKSSSRRFRPRRPSSVSENVHVRLCASQCAHGCSPVHCAYGQH